ncbi:MAG: GTP 3',8-cyclase MoaA, partial [SAR202 cluster bacterium]|nr:GTP 3',8-cyclase MoaA [SAR202 cluster bacterium]
MSGQKTMTTATGHKRAALRDVFGRPFRDLRISVTDRCNFRCTYCMPAEIFGERYEFLPRKDLLTFEEITRVTRILLRLGGMKLRLTGGEPLVRNGVEHLVAMLAKLDGANDLTMTTNGYLLPKFAQKLKDVGLERVTVSLDSLDDEVFKMMNGRGFGVLSVLAGIEAAENAGFPPIKINAVVIRGVNDHTVVDTARYFKERGHIVRFIEYMDVGNLNGWKMDQVVTADEIIAMIDREMPLEPVESEYRGEVANRYRYRDGSGEIGVIASVTKPFCGDCTRLRLSPEGQLYTCLFGTKGADIRAPLRSGASDDDIEAVIRKTWAARTDRYSEERTSMTAPRRKVE